jgi:RNA polymerase sigma-70 factor, ECF subfamily
MMTVTSGPSVEKFFIGGNMVLSMGYDVVSAKIRSIRKSVRKKEDKHKRELYNREIMEEKDFVHLYKTYAQRLLSFVKTKIPDVNEAEDIMEDTLVSALDSLPTFAGKSSLFTWVCGIARHEIGDFYRKKKIKQIVFSKLPFLKELVSEALGPELAFQELETKRKIGLTLHALSEGYCQILRLKYVDELSMWQIAEKLHITVKAVESRLTRARLAFVKLYDQKDYQAGRASFD